MYLPVSAEEALKALGVAIRQARQRRRWTIAELASKMSVSAPTLIDLEKGRPTVGLGVMISALWILGLEKEISWFAHPEDPVGQELLNHRLPKRIRHSTRRLNNEF